MILFKALGVAPVPNYTRDINQGIARWDAYPHVPDPDALAFRSGTSWHKRCALNLRAHVDFA